MTNPYLGATMKMPLADGATFAGYTIVRLLGSGGWVRFTWPSTRDCHAATR